MGAEARVQTMKTEKPEASLLCERVGRKGKLERVTC